MPKIDLREYGRPFDGPYTWEISGAHPVKIEINTPVDENGREGNARRNIASAVSASGGFQVVEGQIMAVDKSAREEEQK